MHPAKAVGQNEVPFGRDIGVVRSNIILDRGAGPTGEGVKGCIDAAYRQVTLDVVVYVSK